jgi:DNA-binding winged helix-turn-helix (wHTH) protein
VIARFDGLTFDSARRQVLRENGESVHLTPKAFDLLALLIAEAPSVVHKSEIHDRLWPGTFVTDATLVGLVKEVRRALQDRAPGAPIIRTSHGVGYAFCGGLEKPSVSLTRSVHWIVDADRRIPLSEGEHVIGRDPVSAVWLDFAGVSRRHARIVVHGRSAELEDLGSKNGTLIQETLVTSGTVLRDGDSIRIGPVRLTYRLSESGLSTETVATKLTNTSVADPAGRGSRNQT